MPPDAGRLLSGLGFAARAGRLRVGLAGVERAVRDGRAAAIVVAADAPPGVRAKLERIGERGAVPRVAVLDGDRLGRAIGRSRVVALAVTDRSLARMVLELAEAVEG